MPSHPLRTFWDDDPGQRRPPAPYRNGQELSSPPALPLGIDPNAALPEETFQLVNGDRLTLLTDGVPEASCRGELFGFERAASLSTSFATAIAEAALRFGQADDITDLTVIVNR